MIYEKIKILNKEYREIIENPEEKKFMLQCFYHLAKRYIKEKYGVEAFCVNKEIKDEVLCPFTIWIIGTYDLKVALNRASFNQKRNRRYMQKRLKLAKSMAKFIKKTEGKEIITETDLYSMPNDIIHHCLLLLNYLIEFYEDNPGVIYAEELYNFWHFTKLLLDVCNKTYSLGSFYLINSYINYYKIIKLMMKEDSTHWMAKAIQEVK